MENAIGIVEDKMQKALSFLIQELSGIRTGRANPNFLDSIVVEVYGQSMPLSNVASITVQDARTLHVSVWDNGNTSSVDKAIQSSNLGLNPRVDGNNLYVSLPELTEERRQEYVKLVKKKAEDAKINIRNARRDANDSFKAKEKSKEISEDQLNTALDRVQKLTDDYIKKIDLAAEKKQKDILTI